MVLQEGHTVLMPSRSRQLGGAVSSAIRRVHVGSIRYEQLNGVQVSRNRGGVKRGSPFMVVGRGNEDSMQQHRLNCAKIFVVRSIYEQISGTR
jgi:hypothetical protein